MKNIETNPKRQGYTLLEIVITSLIILIIISIGYNSFILFSKGFRKNEEKTKVMNEVILFISKLRNDLINSLIPNEKYTKDIINSHQHVITPTTTNIGISLANNQLDMFVYKDIFGNIEKVSYVYYKDNTSNLSFIDRITSSSRKNLLKANLATFSWKIEEEVITLESGSQIKRVWLNIELSFIPDKIGIMQEKPIELRFKIFPVRLNKQLNN